MPVAQPAQITLVEFGTRVIVPDTSAIGVVTTEPNWQGRVRLDWDDERRIHHFGFYSPSELVEAPEETEAVLIPILSPLEAPRVAETPWEAPWVDPFMDLS